jgi:hypothetical protein
VGADRGRLQVTQRASTARAAFAVVAVEREISLRRDHPHDDLAEQGEPGLAEVLGSGSCEGARRARIARVVLGVEHEHRTGRPIGSQVRDEASGDLRASLDVGQVGQVDSRDETDAAARRTEAHRHGAVAGPEAQLVGKIREHLPGLADPDRGGVHRHRPLHRLRSQAVPRGSVDRSRAHAV